MGMRLRRQLTGDAHEMEPGEFRRADDHGQPCAVIRCPGCSTISFIGPTTGHKIFPDGQVVPSCVCTHDGCSFHEWITLDGWEIQ